MHRSAPSVRPSWWHRPIVTLMAAAPAALIVLLLGVLPLGWLIRMSLYARGGGAAATRGAGFYQPGTWSTESVVALWSDPVAGAALEWTLRLSTITSVLCLVVGLPMALVIGRLSARWRRVVLLGVLLPKLTNVLVLLFGLMLTLGASGPLSMVLGQVFAWGYVPVHHNALAVVLGKTWLLLPYAVLLLTRAVVAVDPAQLRAARGLGAGPWAAFLHVTLPSILPTMVLTAGLLWVWGIGAFVAPYLMGAPDQYTLAVEVQRATFEQMNWPRGAALAVLLLMVASAALLVTGGVYWAVTRRLRDGSMRGQPCDS